MQQNIIRALVLALIIVHSGKAQTFEKLNELKSKSVTVYYSSGHEQRTTTIALRVDNAITYLHQLLGFKPTVTMLVLSASDWSSYTDFPFYGMPHYDDTRKLLIVAAEDNEYWKSFLPPVDQLPPNLREEIMTVYKAPAGGLSAQAFFDMLAIHELGHAFHIQGGLTMQRKWMGELFSNILLHTFVAENEPESLPALTLFPQMVVAGGTHEFKYTSLNDIQERYNEIGKQYPKNYGWYQCRWHAAAATIYDSGGNQVLRKLWDALKSQKEILTDAQLISFLETNADKSLADVIRNWERDTVK